ncbi:hypothetical protein [Glycomyces sp. NPDC021274]|uniref:hypothetical protein n=1 Tax=Glycomyces sp. NPDC021274 TaxID=3155120 RepID=UPI0033C349E8
MSDKAAFRPRHLIAIASALLMLIATAACTETEPSDDHWDLVVRELRPRTTGFDVGDGVDRPVRGYPGTMSGVIEPDPVELAEDVSVHAPLTAAQFEEGAALQVEAIEAGPDAEAAWTVLDGVRSCMASVGSGYGHRVLGYALRLDPAGGAPTIALGLLEDGGYDTFDDGTGVSLAIDCQRLYVDDYLAWLNATAVLSPTDWSPCTPGAATPEWLDEIGGGMFDPNESALSLHCGTGAQSDLIARR